MITEGLSVRMFNHYFCLKHALEFILWAKKDEGGGDGEFVVLTQVFLFP